MEMLLIYMYICSEKSRKLLSETLLSNKHSLAFFRFNLFKNKLIFCREFCSDAVYLYKNFYILIVESHTWLLFLFVVIRNKCIALMFMLMFYQRNTLAIVSVQLDIHKIWSTADILNRFFSLAAQSSWMNEWMNERTFDIRICCIFLCFVFLNNNIFLQFNSYVFSDNLSCFVVYLKKYRSF